MNLTDARACASAYLDADIPFMLWGAPGVGKSDTIRAIAAERDWPVIDFRLSTRDAVALMGIPSIEGETTKWRVPDEFPQVERDGPAGLLFLDEINAAAPSIQAAAFGLVLDRKVGEYRLPAGWRVIAAGNRQSDKAAAQRMPTALANRFAHIDIDPDVDTFAQWAVKHGLNPIVIAFLRFRNSELHRMPTGTDERAFPTPRSWAQVGKIIDAPDATRPDLVAGLVGAGTGAELEGFIRVWRDLPKLADIFKDPTGTRLPTEVSAKYAIATALADKVADGAMLDSALIYLDRLGAREFSIMFMLDALGREPGLSKTKPFVRWATENQDVLLNV